MTNEEAAPSEAMARELANAFLELLADVQPGCCDSFSDKERLRIITILAPMGFSDRQLASLLKANRRRIQRLRTVIGDAAGVKAIDDGKAAYLVAEQVRSRNDKSKKQALTLF